MRLSYLSFILTFFVLFSNVSAEEKTYTLKKVDSVQVGKKLSEHLRKAKASQTGLKFNKETKKWTPTKANHLYQIQNVFVVLPAPKEGLNPASEVKLSGALGKRIGESLVLAGKIVFSTRCKCRGKGGCRMLRDLNGNPQYCGGSCGRKCKTIHDIYGAPGKTSFEGPCGGTGIK